MARKNRPILYEVAKRKQQKSQSPVRPAQQAPAPERVEKPVEPPRPAPTPPPAAPESRPSPLAGGPLKTEEDKSTALASFEPNSRLQMWVVGGAAAVILIFIAFALGQGFSTPTRPVVPPLPDEEGEVVANGGNAGTSGESQPTPAPEESPEVYLPAGYYYIVVQHFPKSKTADAAAAWSYLDENGVACAIMEASDIRLVVTKPFENSNDPIARNLLRKVKALGEKYRGGYKFDGASIKKMGSK